MCVCVCVLLIKYDTLLRSLLLIYLELRLVYRIGDFKHHISQYILSTGKGDRNSAVANELLSVKSVLGEWQFCYSCVYIYIYVCVV